MKKISIVVALAATILIPVIMSLGITSCSHANAANGVKSPDGVINLSFGIDNGKPYYVISRNNTDVIDTSFLGMTLKEGIIGQNSTITGTTPTSLDETWQQPWGEESTARNNYNGMIVDLIEQGENPIKYSVEFRVFDDGIGFRYIFPEQENLGDATILDELTQFNLAGEGTAWSIPWDTPYYEAVWKPSTIAQLDTVVSPLTIETADSLYLAIHEANLTDYAKLNLAHKAGDTSTTLTSYLVPLSTGEKVVTHTPFQSPWRTVIIADTPGNLMLSRLMLNLNEPCAIDDTSWIEPGKYIGIWWGMHKNDWTWHMEGSNCHGATTENTKRYIDFAADNGIDAVLVEGWNRGWEGDWSASGNFDFLTPYPDYDLDSLTRYAASKGVRIIAHNETGGAATNYESQIDSAFTLYNRLGMNAVKTGYVNPRIDHKELNGSQYGVRHYRKVIETAAKHHIMVDNHEPVMPTGLQRTWPNLMTQEGVRGGEWDAFSDDGGNPAEHIVTLPFTRGLAGPMDYTPVIFNYTNKSKPNTHPHSTIAKQLASFLVLYSPLQMAADQIENYDGRPEFEFVNLCPTNWAKTVIPDAAIGRHIVMARKDRNTDNWFVGAMTGSNPYDYPLALDFLDPGAKYVAKIFADGPDANGETNPYPVEISQIEVDSKTVLPLQLAPSGGVAIAILKK